MGATKNVDMSANADEIKKVAAPEEKEAQEAKAQEEKATKAPATPKQARSKKYRAVRSKLDKTKVYPVEQAVDLVKELSYSSFEGTITAHAVVKELGQVGSVTLPNKTGKTRNIVIVDDKVLKQIEDGNIDDIDVLIAEPQYMPNLAKFGRELGPKGLMPNPKNGTLTPNPEAKKEELEAGKLMLRTQKKEPVIHVTMGKVGMETKQLVENINTLIKALGPKLTKMSLAATMSPGVRVDVQSAKVK